jgi:hypothetical protein
MCVASEATENPAMKRRIALTKLLVEQKTAAYTELTRIISVIEDKAQKTAISAGALLALGVPIMTKSDLTGGPRVAVNIVLFMVVVLCIVSYWFCLAVMWAREVTGPPHLNEMQRALYYVLLQEDDQMTEEMELRVLDEQSAYWNRSLEEHKKRAETKASSLRMAQGFLVACVCAVAGVLVIVLTASFI